MMVFTDSFCHRFFHFFRKKEGIVAHFSVILALRRKTAKQSVKERIL